MKRPLNRKQAFFYTLGFLAVIAADQLFKLWIVRRIPLNSPADNLPLLPGVLHLTYIRNSGAAFSMLEGARWFFLVLLAVFAAVVILALRRDWLSSALSRWAAVLALGGAVANGIDRALYGYVIDMFETEFIRFAVFNIADVVLCVCAALYLLSVLFEKKPAEKQ